MAVLLLSCSRKASRMIHFSTSSNIRGRYTLKISEIVAEGEETGGDPTE